MRGTVPAQPATLAAPRLPNPGFAEGKTCPFPTGEGIDLGRYEAKDGRPRAASPVRSAGRMPLPLHRLPSPVGKGQPGRAAGRTPAGLGCRVRGTVATESLDRCPGRRE